MEDSKRENAYQVTPPLRTLKKAGGEMLIDRKGMM